MRLRFGFKPYNPKARLYDEKKTLGVFEVEIFYGLADSTGVYQPGGWSTRIGAGTPLKRNFTVLAAPLDVEKQSEL